jgi:Fe-S-cluster containining protein
MPDRYECEPGCGACCKALIIEIEHADVVREPRLLPVATLLDGNGTIKHRSDDEKEYRIACGKKHPCPMLDGEDRCTIYPTRPGVCSATPPGGQSCQVARDLMGLLPLEPCEGAIP